ncbi:carboxymuconolactone decarboxylase family protein [Sphingorhabdus sp.]|jgi:alkylhydroperoxidase/carboxymuconolactone decarboxylase family protein YurZ|uniref:carboxymuconolactone decarboxylase family protein n=1 Tax=Sphingorhabdus sp. TaxID=1902408 RepID=UPI004048D019
METCSVDDLYRLALTKLSAVAEGEQLALLDRALIRLGLAASVTALNPFSLSAEIDAAFDQGASPSQVQEVVVLVSGLGVHSLMLSAEKVLEAARHRGLLVNDDGLDEERSALWESRVGNDPFWAEFEREIPGFLKAMLILSPDIFVGFFDYCAIPWKSGTVSAQTKELIAMASDATPDHRFGPGFRIHLGNAIKLGCSRKAILETLDIAAAAPPHRGIN